MGLILVMLLALVHRYFLGPRSVSNVEVFHLGRDEPSSDKSFYNLVVIAFRKSPLEAALEQPYRLVRVRRNWGRVARDWEKVRRDWGLVKRDCGHVRRDLGQVGRD